MVIAALISFAILFVAWILAPETQSAEHQVASETSEALSIAA
jgi:hypothetical protein